LSSTKDNLNSKFAALQRWERRKRREEILLRLFCAALAGALALLPLHFLLPINWLRWFVPGLLCAGLAPVFFYRRRWTPRDGMRAAVLLDRTLDLEERAVTAWELTARDETSPAAQLVFKQAEERLRAAEPRALFPRRWSWPAYLALPLFALWLTLLWLNFDRWNDPRRLAAAQTLAQKARQFSRELQDKANSERLPESLKMGQEIEKLAGKAIDNKTADEDFKKELAGMAKKIDAAAKSAGDRDTGSAAETEQSLKDLQAEIAAARDLAELPELPKEAAKWGREWAERMSAMPQLKRRMDSAEQVGQGAGRQDLKAFLAQLERQVFGELDRRALLDTQKYLQQMMNQGRGEQGEKYARSRGQDVEDLQGDGAPEDNPGNLPGKEPGKKTEEPGSLPDFRADSATRVKGALGAGDSSALVFKGKPMPGKSAVSPAEVAASYRRQAEQELNSERVPQALKETIKNYFLSLDEAPK
jgi:hypothetical protein